MDHTGRVAGADHSRDAIFARDHGAVAENAARVRYDRGGGGKAASRAVQSCLRQARRPAAVCRRPGSDRTTRATPDCLARRTTIAANDRVVVPREAARRRTWQSATLTGCGWRGSRWLVAPSTAGTGAERKYSISARRGSDLGAPVHPRQFERWVARSSSSVNRKTSSGRSTTPAAANRRPSSSEIRCK